MKMREKEITSIMKMTKGSVNKEIWSKNEKRQIARVKKGIRE